MMWVVRMTAAAKHKTATGQADTPVEYPHRRIPLADIVSDWDNVQTRESLDGATVKEYAEAMLAGALFPPFTVFEGADGIVLSDGFSRHEAAKEAGLADIECEVRPGSKRDAALHACGANATHGQRRTNADKRKAASRLLLDAEWSQWSDNEIAKHAAVSQPFVSSLRAELTSNVISDKPTKPTTRKVRTRHGKITKMRTGNIGKKPAPAKPKAQPQPQPKPYDPLDDMMGLAKETLGEGEGEGATDARARATVGASSAGNGIPVEPEQPTEPADQDDDEFDEPVADNITIAKLLIALGKQPNLYYADGRVIAEYLRGHAPDIYKRDPDTGYDRIEEIHYVLGEIRRGETELDTDALWELWEKHHGHDLVDKAKLHQEVVRELKKRRPNTTVGRILASLPEYRIERDGSKWRLRPVEEAKRAA
jgi:hypothetical protein